MTSNTTSSAASRHLAPPEYRADIDGLRAIAVLSVIGFHAFPNWIRGGFIGVDIFFVISGFLISSIIFRNLEHGSFSYKEFYVRRIRRIFPALVLVLSASLAFGWYVLLANEYEQLAVHTASGAAFVSNFILWNESGYFDGAADTKPLLHLWSLGIEEQFYILWPLLLGLVWKRNWNFLAVTVAIAVISFAINLYTVNDDPVGAFYSPLSRFWELMIGGVLAYITLHKSQFINHYTNIQSLVGIVFISVALVLLNKTRTFPGWWALLPTIGAFLIISAGQNAWLNRKILSNKLMVLVGLISYPLYLWHWPLLVFPKITLNQALTPTHRIISILMSVILAYLTYRYLESPVRKNKKAGLTISLIAATSAVGLIATSVFYLDLQPRNKGSDFSRILNAGFDWNYPAAAFYPAAQFGYRIWRQDTNIKEVTLFLGDSNIEQYAPKISKLLLDNPDTNNSIIFATQGGCPIIPDLFLHIPECKDKMEKNFEMANMPEITTIVFGQSWISYPQIITDTALQNSLGNLIKLFSTKKRVFIVLNMPNGEELDPKNMFEGSRLFNLKPKDFNQVRFDYSKFMSNYSRIRELLKRIAQLNGATVIDPIDYLCVENTCPVFDELGNPLYKDSGHMRPFYVIAKAYFMDITVQPASQKNQAR